MMNKFGADYEDCMAAHISKGIEGELSSIISYVKMANDCTGGKAESEVAEELLEHAKEEYEHFTELVAYAAKHGIEDKLVYNIDRSFFEGTPKDMAGIIAKNQELEQKAMNDYENMYKCAQKFGDVESMHFAKDIMMDEMEHFDDFSQFDGKPRGFVTGLAAKPVI